MRESPVLSVRNLTTSFLVDGEWKSVVRDVSFDVHPGETVAIVGPTGSGKSTALGLFQRAWDPEKGRILVDGQDIRDVTLASLRAATGVVFQEAGLFNRSIADNLRVGKPDATEEEMRTAAARCTGSVEPSRPSASPAAAAQSPVSASASASSVLGSVEPASAAAR